MDAERRGQTDHLRLGTFVSGLARRRSIDPAWRSAGHRRLGGARTRGPAAQPLRRPARLRPKRRLQRTSAIAAFVRKATDLGLAYVPADRKREGLHLIHAIAWNLMLPSLAQARGLSLRDRAKERATAGGL